MPIAICREKARSAEPWQGALPEARVVRELTHTRHRQDLLILRTSDSKVPQNPGYAQEASNFISEYWIFWVKLIFIILFHNNAKSKKIGENSNINTF